MSLSAYTFYTSSQKKTLYKLKWRGTPKVTQGFLGCFSHAAQGKETKKSSLLQQENELQNNPFLPLFPPPNWTRQDAAHAGFGLDVGFNQTMPFNARDLEHEALGKHLRA